MIKWHFACIMFINPHKSLFNFVEVQFYDIIKCQMWISKILLFTRILLQSLINFILIKFCLQVVLFIFILLK